jgi:hypothetical protein
MMVDPPNTLFGLKNIVFGLLLFVCIVVYKTTWKPAWIIITTIYAIISISVVMGYLQGFMFDDQMVKSIYKTYVMLFLLLWINKLSLLGKMVFPALIIVFTIITVYYLITFYPSAEQSIYLFFSTKHNLMGISRRTFVGVDVLGIYYTSVALLVIPLALSLYKALFKVENKIKHYSLSIIFFIALLFAGTRACMLSAIFLTFMMIIIRIYNSRAGRFVVPILICLVVISSYSIVHLLLNDKKDVSLQIKSGHLSSYKKLVMEHPLILILGEGAGSKFYSEGFAEETAQTEWSYFELIRWFGLFGAAIIIFIYFLPLYVLYRKRKILPYSLPIRVGYLFYLFIAGTNPLLLWSNGLLALLVMYSYSFNPNYEQA